MGPHTVNIKKFNFYPFSQYATLLWRKNLYLVCILGVMLRKIQAMFVTMVWRLFTKFHPLLFFVTVQGLLAIINNISCSIDIVTVWGLLAIITNISCSINIVTVWGLLAISNNISCSINIVTVWGAVGYY